MVGRYAEFCSERFAVVATIEPDSYSAEENSDIIDMMLYRRLVAILLVGELGAGATLDMDVEVDTAAAMGGADMVDLKDITQMTQAGGDSDKQVLVEVTAEEVAGALKANDATVVNKYGRYVRFELTPSAASDLALVVLGELRRYEPANQGNLVSVDEIVE